MEDPSYLESWPRFVTHPSRGPGTKTATDAIRRDTIMSVVVAACLCTCADGETEVATESTGMEEEGKVPPPQVGFPIEFSRGYLTRDP